MQQAFFFSVLNSFIFTWLIIVYGYIPGVELVYETQDFTCKNKEFQLLAPRLMLPQNRETESWTEIKLLSTSGLTFFLTSCGTERKARKKLTQKQ
jgi:hypothetical protein